MSVADRTVRLRPSRNGASSRLAASLVSLSISPFADPVTVCITGECTNRVWPRQKELTTPIQERLGKAQQEYGDKAAKETGKDQEAA